MMKTHGILVLIAVAFLMTTGGWTTPPVTLPPAPADLAVLDTLALHQPEVCSADSGMAPGEDQAERVPPGCCTTQCNVDKDCNRICGKGVCACIQETSCCRRCVY